MAGSIEKRPDGRWRARYRGPDRRERAKHFDRKTDARRWLDDVSAALNNGSWTDPSRARVTMADWGAQWAQGQLADKVYAGFTASQTLHGGQEAVLLSLYTTIHHFGGIVVSPGYTDGSKFVDGNPYGVGHVTGGGNDQPVDDVTNGALDHMVTRALTVSRRLNG